MGNQRSVRGPVKRSGTRYTNGIRWALVLYDISLYLLISLGLFGLAGSLRLGKKATEIAAFVVMSLMLTLLSRLLFRIYHQVWRFGGIQSFIRLLVADFCASVVILVITRISALPFAFPFVSVSAFCSIQLLFALAMRMFYRFAYKCGNNTTFLGRFLRFALRLAGGKPGQEEASENLTETDREKIKIAILGAGRTGVTLAEELINNLRSNYKPICFIDISPEKIGRSIYNIEIISESAATPEELKKRGVQEVVFAIPQIGVEERKYLYDLYKEGGFRIKVYDYPLDSHGARDELSKGARKHLREFDISELLFRKEIDLIDDATVGFYSGKTVLITGGGGSIGSELTRQIANMHPERIVILDEYENGAYVVQQELLLQYGTKLKLDLEIISVCNRPALERVFEKYRPDIVLHAAAHKHVPLMEHNCVEAVENNVFGTLNVVECVEKYGSQRFIMVSTDKAVNPTNVMGATKRMCEMLVGSHAVSGGPTVFSATRFGNVLGSAGSVIPLFRRQIANGGPVTITDKRIIRYFMTITEASQLVLQSGAMARNGELFVLDMGKPVKILELAENIIRMSGYEPYKDIDIVFTGLRPGEKLFEELLVKSETLKRTQNSLIFIEKDEPLPLGEIERRLAMLREACRTGSDDLVREALRKAVPTFRDPEEVNTSALQSEEMKNAI